MWISALLGLLIDKQHLHTVMEQIFEERRIQNTWSKTFLAARSDSEPYTWDWETESTLCMDDERPRVSIILLRLVDDPDSFSVAANDRSRTTTELLSVTQ